MGECNGTYDFEVRCEVAATHHPKISLHRAKVSIVLIPEILYAIGIKKIIESIHGLVDRERNVFKLSQNDHDVGTSCVGSVFGHHIIRNGNPSDGLFDGIAIEKFLFVLLLDEANLFGRACSVVVSQDV